MLAPTKLDRYGESALLTYTKLMTRYVTSTLCTSFFALALLYGDKAQATVVLDQSSTAGLSVGSAAIFDNTPALNQTVSQTFTVGVSGVLDRIDVFGLFLRGTGQLPLSLQLRDVSAGQPGATVFATTSVNVGDIVGGTASFDLNGFGLAFTSGDLLSFSLTTDSDLGNDYFASFFSGAYAPGEGLRRLNGGPYEVHSEGADVHFQTFVDDAAPVTEPGMALILCLGLAGISFARHKRTS